jgi:hypothetical protein
MKSSLNHFFLKTVLLFVLLGSLIGSRTIVQAKGSDLLFNGAVHPRALGYRTNPNQGYLMVYSATDEFDDGGIAFNAHSSYVIYKGDGIFLKNVENHISLSDEIPELVRLAPGSYAVEARSANGGYVRVHVVVNPGRVTILDLDLRVNKVTKSLTRELRPASSTLHDFPIPEDFGNKLAGNQ